MQPAYNLQHSVPNISFLSWFGAATGLQQSVHNPFFPFSVGTTEMQLASRKGDGRVVCAELHAVRAGQQAGLRFVGSPG